MISEILGILLFSFPLILICFFENKKTSFLYTLFSVIVFHTCLGFFLQLLGVFNYLSVTIGSVVFDIFVLVAIIISKRKFSFRLSDIDWIAILVILIAFLSLWQVHFNYTGKVSMALDGPEGYRNMKNITYQYPYFSDEWYAVSLIKGAIQTESLPFYNTLDGGFFLNLEIFSHSLSAELMVLMSLDPLTQYSILSLAINCILILLCYLFLRICNIPVIISAICGLSVLYIACGANLPGIWHLIPLTFGVLYSLFGICFLQLNNLKMALVAYFFVSLFYTLLIPFYGTALLIYLFSNIKFFKQNKAKILGYSFLALFIFVPIILVFIFLSPLSGFAFYVFSKLYYTSFTGFFLPQINIFYILPLHILILAIIGCICIAKEKKWIFWQIIIGCVYWIAYVFTYKRFIIEFERVVYFTSILLCLTAGIGFKIVLDYLKEKIKISDKLLKYAPIIILVLLIAYIPFYTQAENWRQFVVVDPKTKMSIPPNSPVNNYLQKDDIEIFSNIKKKRFLSLPWKGTVIGIATDNFPVVSKPGTISMGLAEWTYNFIGSNCQEKLKFAKSLKLDYVYLLPFDCPGFEKIDQSQEGFVLYKTL